MVQRAPHMPSSVSRDHYSQAPSGSNTEPLQPNIPVAPSRGIAYWTTLLGVLAALFISAPAFFYPGDNFASRAEAVHFLATGEFGIPLYRRAELQEFVMQRGQYFYERDELERMFSKYGVAYSLLYGTVNK